MIWNTYICCNFVKFPNSIGIVPESSCEFKVLLTNLGILEQKNFKIRQRKNE